MDLSKVVFKRKQGANQQEEQKVSGTSPSKLGIGQELQRIEENPKEGQSVDTPINGNNEKEEKNKTNSKAVNLSMAGPDIPDDLCNCSFSDEVGDNYFDLLSNDEGNNDGEGEGKRVSLTLNQQLKMQERQMDKQTKNLPIK